MNDLTGRTLPTPEELENSLRLARANVLPYEDMVALAGTHLFHLAASPYDLLAVVPLALPVVDFHVARGKRTPVTVGHTPTYVIAWRMPPTESLPAFGFAVLLPYLMAHPAHVERMDSRAKLWARLGKWLDRAEGGVPRDVVYFVSERNNKSNKHKEG